MGGVLHGVSQPFELVLGEVLEVRDQVGRDVRRGLGDVLGPGTEAGPDAREVGDHVAGGKPALDLFVDLHQGVSRNSAGHDVGPLQRAGTQLGVRLVERRSVRAAGSTH